MSRIEILNSDGYRSDGRKQYELRDVSLNFLTLSSADGSAEVAHGLTRVTASIFGPREAKQRSQTVHNRASISVDVLMAAFSSGDRRKRRTDKRTQELCKTLEDTFESVVITSLYPRSSIDIVVTVLHQDGSVVPACINAITLALIAAGVPLLDFCCAVSVGVHDTHPLLDLTLLEENDVPSVHVAVMPKTGKVVMLNMETRLHVDRFEEVFRLALDASKVLHTEMKAAVSARSISLVAMSGMPTQGTWDDNDMEE
ncbi:ribosomal protein S5 domain 2-like protein [Fistulina hepatica ATCC 64428]|nr:ribosomal protein S5 domain 2-like protein [Fistulina hepatica ATCC 64428]